MSPHRLLIVAPTDSKDVGEAWVASRWVRGLSAKFDVTLLTYRKRGRPSASGQFDGVRVIEWVEPPLVGRYERVNSMLKPGWVPFYVRSRRWLKAAIKRGERFDLAFQPVPVAMRYPSPAVGLGMPVVLGPVGGGLESPEGFDEDDTAPWYVGLRSLDRFRLRHDPLLRKTFADAECVLGIAPYVRDVLDGVEIARFETMSETGIEELPPAVDRTGRDGPVRLLFIGRLIRTKGARDVIRALAWLRDVPVVLDIVGNGFDAQPCRRLVDQLELNDRVTFHGAVDHAEVQSYYDRADIFTFPSYREPGGNVTLEAMASGLPLVVCDRGGPASVVDDSCGVRLPARSPEQLAQAIAAAVRTLASDAQLRLTMGENARRRVADLALWQNKVDRLEILFRDILQQAQLV